jgi:hypothetical protein
MDEELEKIELRSISKIKNRTLIGYDCYDKL